MLSLLLLLYVFKKGQPEKGKNLYSILFMIQTHLFVFSNNFVLLLNQTYKRKSWPRVIVGVTSHPVLTEGVILRSLVQLSPLNKRGNLENKPIAHGIHGSEIICGIVYTKTYFLEVKKMLSWLLRSRAFLCLQYSTYLAFSKPVPNLAPAPS